MRDKAYAEAVQLLAEYAPEPPLSAGNPEVARPETAKLLIDMFEIFRGDLGETITRRARH